jgi:hypothetical protein
MASSQHAVEISPRRATRVNNFASFFKNYMSVSSVVVASLPIPVSSLNLIKTYSAQTKMLSVYTSLFCFLILGFVFFSRHLLGRIMFAGVRGPSDGNKTASGVVGALPLLLIIGSIVMVFSYQSLLSESLVVAKARELAEAQGGELASAYLYDMNRASSRYAELDTARMFLSDHSILASALVAPSSFKDIALSIASREAQESHGDTGRVSKSFVENFTKPRPDEVNFVSPFIGDLKVWKFDPAVDTPLEAIPSSMLLVAYYIGIFAFAEAAFVLMALKEYLLDLLHLSDSALITGAEQAKPAVSVDSDRGEGKTVEKQ